MKEKLTHKIIKTKRCMNKILYQKTRFMWREKKRFRDHHVCRVNYYKWHFKICRWIKCELKIECWKYSAGTIAFVVRELNLTFQVKDPLSELWKRACQICHDLIIEIKTIFQTPGMVSQCSCTKRPFIFSPLAIEFKVPFAIKIPCSIWLFTFSVNQHTIIPLHLSNFNLSLF